MFCVYVMAIFTSMFYMFCFRCPDTDVVQKLSAVNTAVISLVAILVSAESHDVIQFDWFKGICLNLSKLDI